MGVCTEATDCMDIHSLKYYLQGGVDSKRKWVLIKRQHFNYLKLRHTFPGGPEVATGLPLIGTGFTLQSIEV